MSVDWSYNVSSWQQEEDKSMANCFDGRLQQETCHTAYDARRVDFLRRYLFIFVTLTRIIFQNQRVLNAIIMNQAG